MEEYDHLSPIMQTVMNIISRCTLFIYALIAALLIIIALLTFLDAVYLIFSIFSHGNVVTDIVDILDVLHVLLLTIIVVEVLETVTGYFRTKRILVRPILIAGMTAMIRKVLVISVDDTQLAEMIWIIGIIAVLTAAIYVIGKTENDTYSG